MGMRSNKDLLKCSCNRKLTITLPAIIITDLREVGYLYITIDSDGTSPRQRTSLVMPSKHNFFIHRGIECPEELMQVLRETPAAAEDCCTIAHNMRVVKLEEVWDSE